MDLKFTKAVLKESSENKQNIVLLENPGLISYGYLFRKRKYLKDILEELVCRSGELQNNREWITVETVTDFIFLVSKSLQMVTAAMKLKYACSLEEKHDKSRLHIKNQRHYFTSKGPYSLSYGFSSSQVWM